MPRKLREKLGLPAPSWETKTEEMEGLLARGEENLLSKVKEDLIERGFTEEQVDKLASEDLAKLREHKGLDITADVEPIVPAEERPFPKESTKETVMYGEGSSVTREETPKGDIQVTKRRGLMAPEETEIIPKSKFLKQMRKRLPPKP